MFTLKLFVTVKLESIILKTIKMTEKNQTCTDLDGIGLLLDLPIELNLFQYYFIN